MHLPTIIADLAMILLVAGVTTILFKKINQPLVLGYIVAGIITGPNFPYFPTVADKANIATWSEIGVIFLLFALGLEFSFYKLKSVGSTAFIGTATEILGMLFMGFCAGKLLGWSTMDAIFLGGMLSMSSTTIIIKAFDDLNMRKYSFTEIVFGMLIVEDIAGIVMMVLLSTIAVASSEISSVELLLSVGRLVFFLILWFVCGMYLVPTFFKKAKKLMNDETLIVVSVGLCLGMVVLATSMGFSSALGAFIMGSLIAEAPNLHTIEHLIKPVKDLFGAVFFVSVGMLVDPALLLQYWIPVVVIIFVTIIGKLIFSTSGVLLGGQSLQSSVHAGFSLAQIGEFSFIIAGLGTSLGVTSDFIYPIVVAVSVSTTFTTPYFINGAEWGYQKLRLLLPEKIIVYLDRSSVTTKVKRNDSDWHNYLQKYLTKLSICCTLLTAICIGSHLYLAEFMGEFLKPPYHNYGAALGSVVVMAPILRTMLSHRREEQSDSFSLLWVKTKANHLPLMALIALKLFLAGSALFYVLVMVGKLNIYFAFPLTAVVIYLISRSGWLMSQYLKIESHFLVNLNEKHMEEYRRAKGLTTNSYFGSELGIGWYEVTKDSNLLSQTIAGSNFRTMFGCNIVQIKEGDKIIDVPQSTTLFTAFSRLLIVGTQEQFRILDATIATGNLGLTVLKDPVSLNEFTQSGDKVAEKKRLYPYSVLIDANSGLVGKTLRSEQFRNRLHALVIGLLRGSYTMTNLSPDMEFQEGDLLWLLGKKDMIKLLVRKEV